MTFRFIMIAIKTVLQTVRSRCRRKNDFKMIQFFWFVQYISTVRVKTIVKSNKGKYSGVRRIFQWGVSVTSHRDDVKILHYNCSTEVLKCIVL